MTLLLWPVGSACGAVRAAGAVVATRGFGPLAPRGDLQRPARFTAEPTADRVRLELARGKPQVGVRL